MCSITARDTELLTPDSKSDIIYRRLLLLRLLFLFHFIFSLPSVARVGVLLHNEQSAFLLFRFLSYFMLKVNVRL